MVQLELGTPFVGEHELSLRICSMFCARSSDLILGDITCFNMLYP